MPGEEHVSNLKDQAKPFARAEQALEEKRQEVEASFRYMKERLATLSALPVQAVEVEQMVKDLCDDEYALLGACEVFGRLADDLNLPDDL